MQSSRTKENKYGDQHSPRQEAALQVLAVLEKEFVNWRHLTILSYREKLLSVMKGQNTKGTISLYDLSIRKLARIIGNKSLRVVTPFDVEVFKSQCLQGARPTTASIYFRTLKTAFQKAVTFGIIKGNPFSQVRNVIISVSFLARFLPSPTRPAGSLFVPHKSLSNVDRIHERFHANPCSTVRWNMHRRRAPFLPQLLR